MKIDRCHFCEESLEITEDGGEGTHQAARRVPGAAPLGRARHPPGCLVALLGSPSHLYYPPGVKTLEQEDFRSFAAATGRKPTDKKRPSSAGRFRRGDHLPEGEIIAIVIIIVTGIIEIIINIIPNISTISISISSHNCNLCCNPYYLSSLLCWC